MKKDIFTLKTIILELNIIVAKLPKLISKFNSLPFSASAHTIAPTSAATYNFLTNAIKHKGDKAVSAFFTSTFQYLSKMYHKTAQI
jgi:hypothetical protein